LLIQPRAATEGRPYSTFRGLEYILRHGIKSFWSNNSNKSLDEFQRQALISPPIFRKGLTNAKRDYKHPDSR
jgi:hypothetical protein